MDDQTNNKPVEDAEIVTDSVEIEEVGEMDPQTPMANEAETIMHLEDLIKRQVTDIERLQDELKKQKSMFDDTFESDVSYAQVLEKEDAAKREKNAVKDKLMQMEAVIDLKQKMQATKDELKDIRETMSDYLKEYQNLSKQNHIEVKSGDLREIVTVKKLVKKSTKERS